VTGYHDIGGLAGGPIVREEREPVFWEKQTAAMRVLLGEDRRGPLVPLDELRNSFETFGKELYDRLGFFERMMEAQTRILIRKGVFTEAELEEAMRAAEARLWLP
jgi:hypothetical protein